MFKSLFSSPSKSPRKAEKSEKPEKTDKSEGGSVIRRDETDPPLHAAIRAHDHKDAKKLAEKGGEEAVLALDRQRRTSLHVAGEVGEVESLKLVIAHVPRGKLTEAVNTKDRMGNTPLFYACVTGSKKCVQELLRLGADVSVTNIINETLLHAIFRAPFMTKSHVSVVQELLTQTKKISLNSVNDENNTVLQIACRCVSLRHHLTRNCIEALPIRDLRIRSLCMGPLTRLQQGRIRHRGSSPSCRRRCHRRQGGRPPALLGRCGREPRARPRGTIPFLAAFPTLSF